MQCPTPSGEGAGRVTSHDVIMIGSEVYDFNLR